MVLLNIGFAKKFLISTVSYLYQCFNIFHTVSPNKHGNSVTILNLSTLPCVAGTQPLHTFILQPSWVEVDKINIVTEFPCLLGLTVLMITFHI